MEVRHYSRNNWRSCKSSLKNLSIFFQNCYRDVNTLSSLSRVNDFYISMDTVALRHGKIKVVKLYFNIAFNTMCDIFSQKVPNTAWKHCTRVFDQRVLQHMWANTQLFIPPENIHLRFSDVFRGTRKLRIWSHVENRWFSDVFRGTRKLRIWSHVLKKSLVENFIFCAVKLSKGAVFSRSVYSYIRTESGYLLIQPKYRTIRTRINFFFGHFSRREIPKIAKTWVSWLRLEKNVSNVSTFLPSCVIKVNSSEDLILSDSRASKHFHNYLLPVTPFSFRFS